MTQFVLEVIALTKSCNWSKYQYVYLFSKCLIKRVFMERIFHSECGLFLALCATYFFFPFFSNNAPNDHLNSVPLSTHPFFGCFFVIISLNASAIVEAYFHFKGCTLRQQDMKSTATSRYLTSWLYLASLSSLASLFRRYYK